MSSAPEPAPPPAVAPVSGGPGHYRWIICGLLFVATTILYIDRQILGLLKGQLDSEFHWNNTEFGIVASWFQGAYALVYPLFGWFVDNFGVKLGYALSIAGWSVVAGGHWFVRSVAQLKAARALLGASESGNFPCAIKSTAQWFPGKERALATALFNSGANVGPVLAPAIIPLIGAAWGWRGAFVCIGALGYVWIAAWWYFYDSPEKQRRLGAAELDYIRGGVPPAVKVKKTPWLRLLRYRQTWSFVAGKALSDPPWWFFLTWLPDYFHKTRGLDIKHSWSLLATIYIICSVLAIFGGWLPGWLLRRGWSVTRARKTSLFIFACCVLCVLLVSHVGNAMAVVLIGVATAAHQAWSANLFTTVSDMFPQRAVASVVGIGGMTGSLAGMAFQPFAGFVVDYFPQNPTLAYAILFGICGTAYLAAFGLNHLLAPSFEQVALEEA